MPNRLFYAKNNKYARSPFKGAGLLVALKILTKTYIGESACRYL